MVKYLKNKIDCLIKNYKDKKDRKVFYSLFYQVSKIFTINNYTLLFGTVDEDTFQFLIETPNSDFIYNRFLYYNHEHLLKIFINFLEYNFSEFYFQFPNELCILLQNFVKEDNIKLTKHIKNVIHLNDNIEYIKSIK